MGGEEGGREEGAKGGRSRPFVCCQGREGRREGGREGGHVPFRSSSSSFSSAGGVGLVFFSLHLLPLFKGDLREGLAG